jgi:uncharacterized SAM-binding protein YcdF (DUF218 family)
MTNSAAGLPAFSQPAGGGVKDNVTGLLYWHQCIRPSEVPTHMEGLRVLTEPLVLLWLTCLVFLAALWRRRQERRRRLAVFTVLFLILTAACVPAVSYLAVGSLEWRYPPLVQRPADVEAIVVLSGALRVSEGPGMPAQPGEDSVYRCLRAAEMYRQWPQGSRCLVFISGGVPPMRTPVPSLAHVLRQFLEDHKVKAEDIIEEGDSQTTYENAVNTAQLLRQHRVTKVLLITSAYHMERAVRCFRKQGVEVVPCGCHYKAHRFEANLSDFLPNPTGARGVAAALHEWIGVAWYALRGYV